ncbi:MAG: LEVG family PEP-CTERM protein [Cyanobacteria bacterium P01_C01_bin.147]
MFFSRKFLYSIASFTTSVACLAGMSAAASAMNFVPQEQGEINVGLGCLDPNACLTLDPIFANITSLTDSTSGTQSRLFVDYFGQGDQKLTYGSGDSKVQFKTKDAGTNSEGYWFRPSETEADGGNEEKGQLEVGTYLFEFSQAIAELTIDFFDTESWDSTGVMAINGEDIENPDYVVGERKVKSNGKLGGFVDGNIVSQTFYNVSSLELKLGLDRQKGTGDGVNFQMSGVPAPQSVPEPAAAVGLMAIAGLGLARKQKAKTAAS